MSHHKSHIPRASRPGAEPGRPDDRETGLLRSDACRYQIPGEAMPVGAGFAMA
jgi:hypothetical protein